MTMHKGWKLRRMLKVDPGLRYVGVGTADCGHLIVRLNHLAVGQRVFCGKCAVTRGGPDLPATSTEEETP